MAASGPPIPEPGPQMYVGHEPSFSTTNTLGKFEAGGIDHCHVLDGPL